METGIIATLVIGTLLTTGAVVGITSMNGGMTQGADTCGGHASGMHHSTGDGMMHNHEMHGEMHEHCEEHMEEWEHEHCEEHEEGCEEWEHENEAYKEMHHEEWEEEHPFEEDEIEEHGHCGMMG